MKVLCFGSLNIDYVYSVDHFVAKGETLASRDLQVFTGGKGLNQSIALAKAGTQVYHAGAIGSDGRFLLEIMENSGVNTDYISVLAYDRTGNAIIQRDKNGDNCILLYGGANQQITEEQVDSVLSHFSSGDYLILQNEINQLPYIMERARERGMIIVLNPSPMDEKILELPLEYVNIFLFNEVEAVQILNCGGAVGYIQLAEKLMERFSGSTVVLTLGGAGSVCLDSGNCLSQPAYTVEVADTTAAGDTFTGFFISSLLRGKSKQDAMREASAAAAIACSRVGAAPSIPSREEVWRFLAATPLP